MWQSALSWRITIPHSSSEGLSSTWHCLSGLSGGIRPPGASKKVLDAMAFPADACIYNFLELKSYVFIVSAVVWLLGQNGAP